jgi:hypothetical protein
VFREPTKRAESTHTQKEEEKDGSIGQAFLECVARRHFVGWPELFSSSSPFFFLSFFFFVAVIMFVLCVTHSSSLPAIFLFSDPFHPTFFSIQKKKEEKWKKKIHL